MSIDRTALDQLLTTIFMLLAIAAIVIFFVSSNRTPFYLLGGIAVVLRLLQYALRLFRPKKQRKHAIDDLMNENHLEDR